MVRDRYENPINQAPETDPLKEKKTVVKKTDFNRSRMVYFPLCDGLIAPFDWFYTLPNSSEEISYNINAIMTNPYAKKILNGKRGYVKVWYQPLENIWEGARQFFKKGRDYKTVLSIPYYTPSPISITGGEDTFHLDFFTAFSPSAYLGLTAHFYDVSKSPIENIAPNLIPLVGEVDTPTASQKVVTNYKATYGSPAKDKVSALPLAMFNQIYAWDYMPKNLLNQNKDWLPDVEEHFRFSIESSGQRVNCLSHNTYVASSLSGISSIDFDADDIKAFVSDFNSSLYVPNNNWSSTRTDTLEHFFNRPMLNVPRFAQFKGNIFNSGSPFVDLIRGDTPTIDIASLLKVDASNAVASSAASNLYNIALGQQASHNVLDLNGSPTPSSSDRERLVNALEKLKIISPNFSLNLNQLRALTIYTLLGEKMARTDGTYKQYIEKMFGVSPDTTDGRPRYLGGFYFDMQNTDVIQQSETGTTPLGTMSSYGRAFQNGYIGKFQFNDYGLVMATIHIVNEEIYTQGIDREWTMLSQEEFPTPLNNQLGPISIKTKELFLSDSEETDETDFNFVERDSHWKSRRNKALSANALPASIDAEHKGFLQVRNFETAPTFNSAFVTATPKNVDRSVYVSPDDMPWQFSVACNVDSVLPLPYVSQALDFGAYSA